MKTLNERRTEFVHETGRLASIAMQSPIIPALWINRGDDFKEKFPEVIREQCGPKRCLSPKDSHVKWVLNCLEMGWIYGEKYDPEKRTHPNLIPYERLSQLEKNKDAIFLALCEIARKYITV